MSELSDLDFLSSPDNWEQDVICLINYKRKQAGGRPLYGFLMRNSGVPVYDVHIGNVWAVASGEPIQAIEHYPSAQKLIDDGWVVD